MRGHAENRSVTLLLEAKDSFILWFTHQSINEFVDLRDDFVCRHFLAVLNPSSMPTPCELDIWMASCAIFLDRSWQNHEQPFKLSESRMPPYGRFGQPLLFGVSLKCGQHSIWLAQNLSNSYAKRTLFCKVRYESYPLPNHLDDFQFVGLCNSKPWTLLHTSTTPQ